MRRLGLAALVVAVCCACGAGPSVRPDVAVVEHRDGETTEPGAPTTTPIPVPVHEPEWRDCTADTLDAGGLRPGPPGLVFECADVAAPIEPAEPDRGAFILDVLRARLPQTPTDVAPLVFTSGADLPSSTALAALAAGPVQTLLSSRPLVSVDRRGTGLSAPIECGEPAVAAALRTQMLDLGQFTAPPIAGGDGVDTVLALGRDATTACTDTLQPNELAFDADHAAADLDRLRRVWGVEKIGLLATGSGADVALAYAAAHPEALAALVLDSPPVVRADAATAAEARVRGAQSALASFARRCAALACSLGPDPVAAVTDLTDRARRGDLGTVSSNALLTALTAHLGSPRGDVLAGTREFADVLVAAGRGDTAPLQQRIDAASAVTATDGAFVARCSDGRQWPTPGRVRDLMRDWGQRYPVFGPEGALGLLLCASWPATPPPAAPDTAVPSMLTVAGAADPVTGDGAASAVGVLAAVGTPTSTVAWLGSGHPAVSHSQCVQVAVAGYAATGSLPPDGGACPG